MCRWECADTSSILDVIEDLEYTRVRAHTENPNKNRSSSLVHAPT